MNNQYKIPGRRNLFKHLSNAWPAYVVCLGAAMMLHVYLDNELHYTTPDRDLHGQMDSNGPERQMNAIKAMGFKNVSLGDHTFLKCGKGSSVQESYEFSATNLAGEQVQGFVCCGFSEAFSSCTLRF